MLFIFYMVYSFQKEWMTHYLAGLGLMMVLYLITTVLVHFINGIRAHLTLNTLPFTTKFGKWAVVTGSTDGIGRAYAHELAKRGVNLILVSRSQKKLDSVAADIRKKYLIRTKTIAVDFSHGENVFPKIEEQLKDIEIGILVNNVGKQYEYPMFLTEVSKYYLSLYYILSFQLMGSSTGTEEFCKKLILLKKSNHQMNTAVDAICRFFSFPV